MKKTAGMNGAGIEIYTDGSCLKNPGGPGGYAAIIIIDGGEWQRISGREVSTTSNRMEMMAAIAGLEAIRDPSWITIWSDSQLVIQCAQGRWKRRKNRDLWDRLDQAAAQHSVTWRWVKGHNGNFWNEEADKLCGRVARGKSEVDGLIAAQREEMEWERNAWGRFSKF